jgi:hypothetical protein
LFIAKQYFNLDLINDLVDKLIIAISAFLLDFSPFTLEITKAFFNGKSDDEGEGSNRQNNNNNNNNIPNRDSGINPPSSGEASEVAETTSDNPRVEATIEELDEEERRLIAEEARLKAQYLAREQARFLDQLALDERDAQIAERIKVFNDLKNQSQPDGSPVPDLTDIECQIKADIEVLCEDGKRISDEIDAYNAEIDKFHLDLAKLSAQRLEKEINERNSR